MLGVGYQSPELHGCVWSLGGALLLLTWLGESLSRASEWQPGVRGGPL